MRKDKVKLICYVFLALILATILAFVLNEYSSDKFKDIEIKRFVTSSSCSSCYQINKQIFATHPDIAVFDVEEDPKLTKKEFGTTVVKVPQLELVTGEVLIGKDQINDYLSSKVITKSNIDTTLLGVITASAVDSINICAISCLIFLIAFLKNKNSKIFGTLVLFIGTIYVVYTAIGLILLRFASYMITIPQLFKYIGVAIVLILLYAIYKTFEKLTKKPEMRCEGGVCKIDWEDDEKSQVDKLIEKYFLRSESIVLFAIFIAISEFACSGMVYIPTLMLLSNGTKQIFYLLVYNAVFVLPLVVVGIFYKKIQEKLQQYANKSISIYLTLAILVGLLGYTIHYYF